MQQYPPALSLALPRLYLLFRPALIAHFTAYLTPANAIYVTQCHPTKLPALLEALTNSPMCAATAAAAASPSAYRTEPHYGTEYYVLPLSRRWMADHWMAPPPVPLVPAPTTPVEHAAAMPPASPADGGAAPMGIEQRSEPPPPPYTEPLTGSVTAGMTAAAVPGASLVPLFRLPAPNPFLPTDFSLAPLAPLVRECLDAAAIASVPASATAAATGAPAAAADGSEAGPAPKPATTVPWSASPRHCRHIVWPKRNGTACQ